MALSTRSRDQTTVDVTRARQGVLGRDVLIVLIATLVLVVIGFLVAFGAHAPRSGRETVSGQAFDAPPSAAATRQNAQKGGPLAPQTPGNAEQP
jgi:hypothetical protein